MRRRRAGERSRCSCVRTGLVFIAGIVIGWLPAHWHLNAHWSAQELPHWSADATTSTESAPTQVNAGAVTVIGPRNNAAVVAAQLALVASKLPSTWGLSLIHI